MSNAELFIDLYKQLESSVRTVFHLKNNDSISYFLTKHEKYGKWADKIRYCQEVRNLLQHRYRLDSAFPVEPSDEMIQFIKDLLNSVINRVKCSEIAIKIEDLYFRGEKDLVAETIINMNDQGYSQVPILRNHIVTGMFDARSLLRFLADASRSIPFEELTFADLEGYLGLNDRKTEMVVFYPANTYVDELQEIFSLQYKKGRRISAVFITKNGKCDEKIQGMITPWTLLSYMN